MVLKTKKEPIRKCVSCGASKPKKELLRVVINKENQIIVDESGKANGRGAYICKDLNCVELAKNKKKLNHALKCNVTDDIYKEIIEHM